ncbi:hypothetical protein ALC60_07759 [Trachymyrmex zeteki]|uniref:Uncharacterized protein n=1 Tax=Mycetomoellerius zeteki TaxID=64791 RepID=A0A151WYR1_9HYME|nr:hypothetical protein ALC60_07759 [Trachymyrmex zeteki]
MANDAVLVAVFSMHSRLPQVRDKKGDRRHKYAGGRPPTLKFIAGQEWSRAKREETRVRIRVYANDETELGGKPEGGNRNGCDKAIIV